MKIRVVLLLALLGALSRASAQEAQDAPPATEAESTPAEAPASTADSPPPAAEPDPSAEPAPPVEAAPAEATEAPQPYPQTVPVPSPPEPKAEVAKEGTKTQLQEVVVTATKREQSSRKIPATINVIRGEDLENMGARELEDYLKLIPGITMQEGDTNQSRAIAIRGIAPQPNGNVTTGVLVDDVAMSDPYASYLVPDLDPFDLKDLEVLKGPQGTLFGAGALNGAIRYVLNKPKLGVTEGRLFANYLTLAHGGAGVNYGGAINMPIGETFALRGVAMKQTLPGLYDDINANGKNDIDADRGDKNMWRVLGQWKPTDAFTANAFFLRQHNNRDDLSVANSPGGPPPNGEFVRTDTPGPSTAVQEFEIANLDLRYDFDWFTVISETSRSKKFQDINYDGSAVADPAAEQGVESLRLHVHAHTLALSQELRLASPTSTDSNWTWLAGAYYNKYTAHFFLNAPVANTEILAPILGPGGLIPGLPVGLPINLVPNGDGLSAQNIRYEPLQATEMSLFGELTRKLFDKQLEATLGARLYKERLYGQPVLEGGTAPYGNLIHYADAQNMYAKGFNPKASLKWQATRDVLFYTTVARGFQFGGINVPAPLPSDNTYPLSYKPSTIWSYEIGTRTDWLAHTLQLDATVFYIDWTDMQLRQDTQSGNTDYVSNIGKARSMGIESAIKWLTPIPGLLLTNNTSYIRATVQKEYTTSDGDNIPKGQELPASPHVQTSTQLAYKLFFGAFSIAPSVTFSYIGGAWSNVQHETRIFNYGVFDAGLAFNAPQWPMQPEIGVNGSNLLDKRAYNGARFLHAGNTTIDELVNYNKPRAITARITLRF